MKKTIIIILTLIGFLAFGQESDIDRINNEVKSIESDSTLVETQFDLGQLMGVTKYGSGYIKVWGNKKQIFKIVKLTGLSYGRLRTIIYLNNGIPIKIIETEKNFGYINGKMNFKELNEVFKVTIHIFDWEKEDYKIVQTGKRVLSEGSYSKFDYEEIIKSVKKATEE
ncbi:hypothetical protein J8L85_13555 [Maribacter sp. MMG018]|uniref:hypothetical protein n=1 Tax=Maribacter sp. MMG018 TaxID=2822688 RepID=UPI001B3661B9|nr:hypothetical protein [Maribacter sp. MMG018]MBQ4915475.1 hypothetical protein [Maribacter sp. MMG018]